MPPKDSIANTFLVSVALCIVCSLLVSSAAVALKDTQEVNKLLDRQRNIVEAAGLAENARSLSGKEVQSIFENIERKLVDLSTGEYVENPDESFDPKKAAKNEADNAVVKPIGGGIGIAKREKQTWVYLVKSKDGNIEQVILPIYGKGLWSTMYGYVALKNDFATLNGLTYYEHGETPGLGGEVDNPKWKRQWHDKLVWVGEPEDENLRIGVAKGSPAGDDSKYKVDGLSGATITSRGVDTMLKYWFSSDGFGPYLKKLAAEKGATNGSANS
jgi:Na+-transporting NADH:ubiquinone oxidoreductase subunit C